MAQRQSPAWPGVLLLSWVVGCGSHSQFLRLLKLELLAMRYVFRAPVTCFGGFVPSLFFNNDVFLIAFWLPEGASYLRHLCSPSEVMALSDPGTAQCSGGWAGCCFFKWVAQHEQLSKTTQAAPGIIL